MRAPRRSSPQAQVEPLARELEAVERGREHEHRRLADEERDEDPAAEVRRRAREHDGMDDVRLESRIARKLTGTSTTPKSA